MPENRPLFADGWYDVPRIAELRQEVQNLYDKLGTVNEELASLAEDAPYLPLAGGTMTGLLSMGLPLSTAGKAIALNHGYEVYADNAGTGSDNTRLWVDTPNNGEVVLGPRSGASFLHRMRLRTNDLRIEGTTGPQFLETGVTAHEMWHGGNLAVEQGFWTPEYVPNTGAFGSITYGNQAGYYIRVGNHVTVRMQLSTNAITMGTASGTVYVSLPFVPNTNFRGAGAISYRVNWNGALPTAMRTFAINPLVALDSHPDGTTNSVLLNTTHLRTTTGSNQFIGSMTYVIN